jgi:hypothetical protein
MSSIESTPHLIISSEWLIRKPLISGPIPSKTHYMVKGFAQRLDQVRSTTYSDRTR